MRHACFVALLLAAGLSAAIRPAIAQPPDAEILRNGSFEGGGGPDGRGGGVPRWEPLDRGYDIDRNVHHGGDQSIRCDNLHDSGRRGAACTIPLDQTHAAPILVTGWSKADAVSGNVDTNYSLYIDLTYADGDHLYGQAALFRVGTHDWERKRVLIYPAKPVKSIIVNALFRAHSGSAWFDDFSAHALGGDGLFDGQVLRLPPPESAAGGKTVSVTGRDGLSVTLDGQGSISRLHSRGQDVPGKTPGGFYIRDVAAEGRPVQVRGATRAYHGTGVEYFCSPPGIGIKFYVKIVPDGDALLVDGELTDTTNADRAVTVYMTLPVASDGHRWWQDIRRSEPVDSRGEWANLTRVNVGASGGISLYPFGVVGNSSRLTGIANQMDWPNVFRIFYNGPSQQLCIAWDFGLTGKTAAWPSHNARFRCRLFQIDGPTAVWGFRAAAERFYRLNSPNFDRRAAAEGIWMPFTDPAKVPNIADFGIAYHEGDNSVASDDKSGILSFRYTEPMTWWMPMPPAAPRTYDSAIAQLNRTAAAPDTAKNDQRDMARAVLSSGSQDLYGKFNIEFRNEPWANGAVFVMNPNPELPTLPGKPTRASIAYSISDAIKRYGPEESAKHGTLDGEYLDSLESWSDVLDYRPSTLQASPYPVTFESDSRMPCIPQWFSTHTFTRFLRDDLHNRGKLLMANSTPIRFSIFSGVLDIMGIEVNWLGQDGKWQPETDETMSMRRTLANRKPYLLLMNTNFANLSSERVEKYFQRCMFYAIYPSMFSADAATNTYWDTPALYNRDRPLFKRYIPAIRKLSSAGWEPITLARSPNAAVFVERYGTRLFTLMNSTAEAQSTDVRIESTGLRLTAGARAANLMTGSELSCKPEAGAIIVHVTLQPNETIAMEFN